MPEGRGCKREEAGQGSDEAVSRFYCVNIYYRQSACYSVVKCHDSFAYINLNFYHYAAQLFQDSTS